MAQEPATSGEWLSNTTEFKPRFPALLVAYQRSGGLGGDPCVKFELVLGLARNVISEILSRC
jgi:hypothetical protein